MPCWYCTSIENGGGVSSPHPNAARGAPRWPPTNGPARKGGEHRPALGPNSSQQTLTLPGQHLSARCCSLALELLRLGFAFRIRRAHCARRLRNLGTHTFPAVMTPGCYFKIFGLLRLTGRQSAEVAKHGFVTVRRVRWSIVIHGELALPYVGTLQQNKPLLQFIRDAFQSPHRTRHLVIPAGAILGLCGFFHFGNTLSQAKISLPHPAMAYGYPPQGSIFRITVLKNFIRNESLTSSE